MKTFVIGDIHGSLIGLRRCLQRSKFDYENDRLIALGDVCDRGRDVAQCIDELLKIKHCVYIIGNHDLMALDWAVNGIKREEWLSQGGLMTIESYGDSKMTQAHIDFIQRGRRWFEEGGRIFVHAGFDPELPIVEQSEDVLVWDRALVDLALRMQRAGKEFSVRGYKEVFIGHTLTINFSSTKPLRLGNLWLMDTGAGYGKLLSIMDVDTKQFWQG